MGGIYFIKEHSQFRVENIESVELSCSKKISLALLEKLKVHETFLLQKKQKPVLPELSNEELVFNVISSIHVITTAHYVLSKVNWDLKNDQRGLLSYKLVINA